MTQNWPIRYKCRKCTRSTSTYPFGCDTPDCPIKRDMKKDIKWDFIVGLPITIFLILLMAFCVYLFFSLMAQR